MEILPKQYDFAAARTRWNRFWREEKIFEPDLNTKKPVYSIVVPPPNVTSILHVGHALNAALQDILIRWKKLSGFEVEWLPGVDHASIATEVVLGKELRKEGISKQELGREKFLERAWAWKNKYGDAIVNQFKEMGSGLDWSRLSFTMDPGASRAVMEVFVRLYDKGLIYRGNYIINWCPTDKTSLSDDEVETKEEDSSLWYVRYPVEGSKEFIVVATARPETIMGDTAIAVHPENPRFKHLIGKRAIVPFVNRAVPILAESYVDLEFGTGALKVTPAHDPNDFQLGQKHKLPTVNILNPDGTLNAEAGPFAGLERFEARKKVAEALKEKGLLEKTEPYHHSVGVCDRCGTVLEPYLSLQWFVKMKPLAGPALKVYEDGKLRFHPEHWGSVYSHWLENIRDWCISRQLWWGHRIPVYYCDCGATFVSVETPKSCPKCKSASFRQDEDVLDTWFSSWLWPFSTFGWPEKTRDLELFYPTQSLFTASEIIFLWVARMVAAGLEFMGKEPFADVYIHGTVRDSTGRKMSKSLGNGIDPLEIIDQFGPDALRATLVFASPEGEDPKLSPTSFEQGRNFANKLWNAARFVQMSVPNLEKRAAEGIPNKVENWANRWMLGRWDASVAKVTKELEAFRFNAAALALYELFWHDFADWYLELSKTSLRQGSDSEKAETERVLASLLRRMLIFLHPFVPFVTEELFASLGFAGNLKSITQESWQKLSIGAKTELELEEKMEVFQQAVTALRNLRAEAKLPPGQKVPFLLSFDEAGLLEFFQRTQGHLADLIRASEVKLGLNLPKPERAGLAVLPHLQLYLIQEERTVDAVAERQKLSSELERISGLIAGASARLSDSQFLSKAPEAIRIKEKEKLSKLEGMKRELEESLKNLGI
ncbi:MAG: valine--tRNA ligase [candidate division Zixibacteria bacterium]|nr:valine--tRNA ligase [candidate division Zixibacteria bacterium]